MLTDKCKRYKAVDQHHGGTAPRHLRFTCAANRLPARHCFNAAPGHVHVDAELPHINIPQSDVPASSSRIIMVAVDDSQESEYAFQWATQQLHRAGDRFPLVHCVPSVPPGRLVAVPGSGLLRTPQVDPALLAEKAAVEADTTLASKFMDKLAASQVQGGFQVLRGPPSGHKHSISAALCQQARADNAAAVVIGSASRGGLKEVLFGSIAADLVHNCDAPVVILHKPKEGKPRQQDEAQASHDSGGVTWLLKASTQDILGGVNAQQLQRLGTRPNTEQQMSSASTNLQQERRNLVVAIDDSEEGYAAVSWVLKHLWRSGDVLHLLHVVPALPAHMSYSIAPDGMLYSLPLPQIEEAQVEEDYWRKLLMDRISPLLQAQEVDFQLNVLTDYGSDPLQGVASAIVLAAEELNAAALVVCGHSKGSFTEWLLGSVSDYAAHHAGVPVVVLHGLPCAH